MNMQIPWDEIQL